MKERTRKEIIEWLRLDPETDSSGEQVGWHNHHGIKLLLRAILEREKL